MSAYVVADRRGRFLEGPELKDQEFGKTPWTFHDHHAAWACCFAAWASGVRAKVIPAMRASN